MSETQRDHDFTQLALDRFQVVDDALRRGYRNTREGWAIGHAQLRDSVVKRAQIVGGPADDEQERVDGGMNNFSVRRFVIHMVNRIP